MVFHCLPPFRYSVTGSLLHFTHVSMEQAIGDHGRNHGIEAGSKRSTTVVNQWWTWSTTVVNQWWTSLGASQNSRPLVNHGAHLNLLLFFGDMVAGRQWVSVQMQNNPKDRLVWHPIIAHVFLHTKWLPIASFCNSLNIWLNCNPITLQNALYPKSLWQKKKL